MSDYSRTILEMFNHLIQKHPELAPKFEEIAATAQGKGYGAATIQQEVNIVLQQLGNQPLLAMDMGGNRGEYTAELRRRAPAVEIHTFEPSWTNIQKLNSRFAGDAMIKIIPSAISEETGSATLYSNEPGSGLGSLTKRNLDHFNIPFDAKETISTLRFEEYWREELNSRVLDIVKIDIEGHELSALNGFGAALAATKVIQFEFGGCNIDTRTYFRDFWYFFQARNFSLRRITPFGGAPMTQYKESDEFFSTTNYIAVNNHLAA